MKGVCFLQNECCGFFAAINPKADELEKEMKWVLEKNLPNFFVKRCQVGEKFDEIVKSLKEYFDAKGIKYKMYVDDPDNVGFVL